MQVHYGMHRRRASHRVDGDFRQRDVADVASLYKIGDGANCVLVGDRRIEASGPIDVDVVQPSRFSE